MDSSYIYPPQQIGATSLNLLERVRRNDSDAWRELVLLYGPVVRYWVRCAGVVRHEQADVFQEIFVAIHRKVADFQPHSGAAKFRSWLKAIALSKIADYFRHRGRRPVVHGGTDALIRFAAVAEAGPLGSDSSREDGYSSDEHGLLYRHALQIVQEEFEDRSWRAFWRTAVDGQSAVAVAEELGITAVAVRKAKSRVLCRLREFLGAESNLPAVDTDGQLS